MNHVQWVIAASLILAAPAVARAQDADDSDVDQARTEAQALNKEGVALLGKQDYAAALDRFQKAYAIFPSPKVLINIAASLKSLGRNGEAANTYQKWLDDPGAESSRRPDVVKVLAQLDPKLGIVSVTVTPADAEVQVDGWSPGWMASSGETPWLPAGQVTRWRVTPGPFTVRVRKGGFVAGQDSGSVNAGAKATVTVTLVEEVKQPDPVVVTPPEQVAITTEPDDEIEQPIETPPAPTATVRLGALVDIAIDGKGQGAAISPGVSVTLIDRLELVGKAQISGVAGMYVGASYYVLGGRFRPLLAAGAPVFFSNGVRIGVRGAGGLSIELHDRLSVVAEFGAEYFFNPEMDRYGFVLVPVVGVHGRL
jgi:hypothetical protein